MISKHPHRIYARIDKSVDPSSVILYPEGQGDPDSIVANYFVTVDATYTDNLTVEGSITIYNPATIPAIITDVSDLVSPDIDATITDPPIYPYMLAADGDLVVHYTADLTNSDFRTNTATATLQNYDYDSDLTATISRTTGFTGCACGEDPFDINYQGYETYIGDSKSLTPSAGSAVITLHTSERAQQYANRIQVIELFKTVIKAHTTMSVRSEASERVLLSDF